MLVLKFGGTSMRDAERIQRVASIVAAEARRNPGAVAVVVSAMSGVTDDLVRAAELATRDLAMAQELASRLAERHRQALAAIAPAGSEPAIEAGQAAALGELVETLRGISLLDECSPRTRDRVLSFGERLSAPLLAASLRHDGLEAEDADARALIRTDSRFGNAQVDQAATGELLRAHFASRRGIQVITGFIASSQRGETTTIGRGGSDLTAALVGAALDASEIQIWTDVDGVMSADPRLVPEAFSLPVLSFEELLEMSHFGAKVVFPPTLLPARQAGIPLSIRNTLNPSHPGSRVLEQRPVASPGRPVTGIASIHRVSLVLLEGNGMAGVPGIAGRLFAALARAEVSVILISQASSAHSICFAVSPDHAERARIAIAEEFALEHRLGQLGEPVVEHHQSVVAVVGEGMRRRPGISGRVFGQLGRHGISVRAIAQGSSELNISVVVDGRDEGAAVRVVHRAFFPAEPRLEICLAGVGGVGAALLRQLAERAADRDESPRLRLIALFNRGRQWCDREGIDLALANDSGSWRARLEERGEANDREALRRFLTASDGPRVFVDASASTELEPLYEELLLAGWAVVSVNKLPFSGTLATWDRLHAASARAGVGLDYAATVGAGLPVLRTLRSLVDAGDRLLRLEGTFSGTLVHLLAAMRAGEPFSAALRQAHRAGYTEPDPREDLSGRDVARKLLILAREAGARLEPGDIELVPFVEPPPAQDLEELWQELPALDAELARQIDAASDQGRELAYVARLEAGHARIALEAVDSSHPCFGITGTDNLFALTTSRYQASPLRIRGPGAGVDVTAAAALAGILRVQDLARESQRSQHGADAPPA